MNPKDLRPADGGEPIVEYDQDEALARAERAVHDARDPLPGGVPPRAQPPADEPEFDTSDVMTTAADLALGEDPVSDVDDDLDLDRDLARELIDTRVTELDAAGLVVAADADYEGEPISLILEGHGSVEAIEALNRAARAIWPANPASDLGASADDDPQVQVEIRAAQLAAFTLHDGERWWAAESFAEEVIYESESYGVLQFHNGGTPGDDDDGGDADHVTDELVGYLAAQIIDGEFSQQRIARLQQSTIVRRVRIDFVMELPPGSEEPTPTIEAIDAAALALTGGVGGHIRPGAKLSLGKVDRHPNPPARRGRRRR